MKTAEELAAEEWAAYRYYGDHWTDQDAREISVRAFLAGIAWRDENPKRPVDPHGRGKWTENE